MPLHIEVLGKGAPLVFFHGWGFDHRIWLPLAKALSQTWQLHLVDLPGYGMSPSMGWDDFKTALNKKIPAPFTAIGWSLGGLFATRLAAEERFQVHHLINIASTPCFTKKAGWPGMDERVLTQFFNHLSENPSDCIAEFIRLQLQDTSHQYLMKKIPDFLSLRQGLDMLKNWDLREALHQITRPVCFMFGHLDAIVSRITPSVMQKHYPDFQYVVFKKAAHTPFLSHSEAFIEALTTELTRTECK
ncbi:MAG: alpha/beta fold hydrolase [Tatlockia sp.]|jgi:pimeloyl-[acyl-carrier protein] methyl ester esterase